MATIKELKERYGLVTVKRGTYYTVFRNTRTGEYELWETTRRGIVIGQDDVFPTKAEALDCLAWHDPRYESEFEAWLNG